MAEPAADLVRVKLGFSETLTRWASFSYGFACLPNPKSGLLDFRVPDDISTSMPPV